MKTFTRKLLNWYDPTRRPLAWKHITNPYLIWLSEIILQQTRAAQGAPYFEKFKAVYPTVVDLANAPEDEVMKNWEGLGYYSRARNLHAAAKYITTELEGVFPDTYEGIRALKGVGPYTAAAIASFAYGLPHAVVDGNVYRLLSRYYDDATAIDTTAGQRYFRSLAQDLLPPDQAAIYNQSMMDMGATVCTPKAPLCGQCPLAEDCQAQANGTISERPVKVKKLQRRTRYFNYLVLRNDSDTWLQKRSEKDIWRNLYQFPLLETETQVEDWQRLITQAHWPDWLPTTALRLERKVGPQKQELTHQRIVATFWELDCLDVIADAVPETFLRAERGNYCKFAFPKVISLYLENKSLTLF